MPFLLLISPVQYSLNVGQWFSTVGDTVLQVTLGIQCHCHVGGGVPVVFGGRSAVMLQSYSTIDGPQQRFLQPKHGHFQFFSSPSIASIIEYDLYEPSCVLQISGLSSGILNTDLLIYKGCFNDNVMNVYQKQCF